MHKKSRRVLLALGWYDYRLHRGIARFAEEQHWHLCPDTTKEKVVPWGWEGDGILAWLGAGDDLADFVAQAKKPTVDFSFRRPHLKFPRVLLDHAADARLAADHFLSRGFEHFGYYSDQPNWSFEERGYAFVSYIQQAGHHCDWLAWHRSPKFNASKLQWQHKRQWLRAQLKVASKPLALFAATDDHAVEVLECCEDLKLAVPEQVSIVGVDNSLMAVEAMRTPISTVDTNMELLGYRGAALLNDLMNGTRPPKEPIRVLPSGLIARKSSDLIAVSHAGVAKSLRFLLEHCHEPIGVDDLARAAAMSRRALHQAFLDHIGRPPGAELHRVRIERVKKLLMNSDHKLEVVAEMSGYQSANSLWVAFKQTTGVSPKEYRDSLRR